MKASDFTNIFSDFDPYDKRTKIELEKLTKIFPYFQTAYFYYIKSLQKQRKVNYQDVLEITAIKTFDRSLLLNWINNSKLLDRKKMKAVNVEINSEKDESVDKKANLDKVEIDKLNFLDWISITDKKSFSQKKYGINSKKIKKFIEKNPTINKLKKDDLLRPDYDIVLKNDFSPEELMTETLAKIFVKQEKYSKAIEAYKILILKYPEKNTLFANEINKLKKLKKNNT
tara:strand:- start:428 stop:1111 length:684 start_codon:yes stop_codon:yes gene_type:complete